MRNLLSILVFAGFIMSFKSDRSKHPSAVQKNTASSILNVTNLTSSSTITSITINYTQTWHNPMTYTYTTSILPSHSQNFDLGNTDENITITLGLSNSISGTINDRSPENDSYPLTGCTNFSSTSNPGIGFYFYSTNYLTIYNWNNPC